MRLNFLAPAFVVTMILASCAAFIVPGRFSLQAIADNATVSTPFNITAPGLITLAISGQLQCGVQITSPVQSLNATPQFGSGGPFTADPNINGGNGIKTSGAYYGANPNPGLYTIFQLNVQSFTLPTLNGQIICGDSLPTSGTGTGPTGAPGPAATISGSPPVVATQPTSGTFYISLPSPFPSAAATACGANVTVTGYTVEVPICATDSPGPSLPLSIANGGTGTAAPAPTGANGCTVGTFPSLVVSCPSAAPLPSVTATACAGAPNLSAGVLSIPAGCQTSPVPSPLVTSTACAAAPSVSGATIVIPAGCSGGGTCSVTATPPANACEQPFPVSTVAATIQPGTLSGNAIFLGPAPAPSATANYIAWAAGSAGCGSSQPAGYVALGTNYNNSFYSLNGLSGSALTLWCYNTSDTPPFFAVNVGVGGQRCCVAVYENVFAQGYDIDAPAYNTGNNGLYWESNNPYGCGFSQHGSAASYTTYYDAYPATPSPNACSLSVNAITLASGATTNKGQLTCTLSTLVCTQTATVISGAICTASYDTAATTVTASLLLPLTVQVATTTLTISMQGAPTASGTAAADYLCL